MSTESDPVLELADLLDSARLAAAWQRARDRAPTGRAASVAADDSTARAGPPIGGPDDGRQAASAESLEPVGATRTAPLSVARAHRELLDEIERMLAVSPGLAAHARGVLRVPLAQLAAAIERLAAPLGSAADAAFDVAAVDHMLDDLEDVLQALLSAAGWPAGQES